MKKVYYLSTCDTCKRIFNELGIDNSFEKIDLKNNPILESDLDLLRKKVDSYESLFNKRARKYKEIKETIQSDLDFRQAILKEYTFIKRPVFFVENKVFVGNSKKNILDLQSFLNGL